MSDEQPRVRPTLVRAPEASLTSHPAVRLYLDDVQEAYALLAADGRTVKIVADGYASRILTRYPPSAG